MIDLADAPAPALLELHGDLFAEFRPVWLTETRARRLEAAIPVWREAQDRLEGWLSSDLARLLAKETEALVETCA